MARFYSPTVIFIDEVDALCSKRGDNDCDASRRVKSEFLTQMDGCNSFSSANVDNKDNKENENNQKEGEKSKLVMVLGATNRPWDLDEAMIRRFEKRVYIPLPNSKGREELFRINLKNVNIDENISFEKLVSLTENYSGADISNVCREASLMNMRRKLFSNNMKIEELVKESEFIKDIKAPISENDLLDAIKNVSKSVSNEDLKAFEDWSVEFKSV